MKYYIIAGEASGDLHGSNLMKALQVQDPEASFRVWGGDRMQAAGGTLVKHYKDMAFMGFVEVIMNLRTIFRNLDYCKADIEKNKPDALILIDYSGFNLRVAEWAKEQGIRIYYYISPQVWASRANRVKKIKAFVERLFVILPFEQAFYAKYDYEVDFVGHPLLDVIEGYDQADSFLTENGLDAKPIIALLPGSRRQEINRMLTTMLQVSAKFPDYQFVIAGAPSIPPAFYEGIIQKAKLENPPKLIQNKTYDLLNQAHAALVTSGTATLETALFKVPQVVCYAGSPISYQIAKRIIKVKYIALVNLILDRPLVKELIQNEFTPANLAKSLQAILHPNKREEVQAGYTELQAQLGQAGASKRTAKLIVQYLQQPVLHEH